MPWIVRDNVSAQRSERRNRAVAATAMRTTMRCDGPPSDGRPVKGATMAKSQDDIERWTEEVFGSRMPSLPQIPEFQARPTPTERQRADGGGSPPDHRGRNERAACSCRPAATGQAREGGPGRHGPGAVQLIGILTCSQVRDPCANETKPSPQVRAAALGQAQARQENARP